MPPTESSPQQNPWDELRTELKRVLNGTAAFFAYHPGEPPGPALLALDRLVKFDPRKADTALDAIRRDGMSADEQKKLQKLSGVIWGKLQLSEETDGEGKAVSVLRFAATKRPPAMAVATFERRIKALNLKQLRSVLPTDVVKHAELVVASEVDEERAGPANTALLPLLKRLGTLQEQAASLIAAATSLNSTRKRLDKDFEARSVKASTIWPSSFSFEGKTADKLDEVSSLDEALMGAVDKVLDALTPIDLALTEIKDDLADAGATSEDTQRMAGTGPGRLDAVQDDLSAVDKLIKAAQERSRAAEAGHTALGELLDRVEKRMGTLSTYMAALETTLEDLQRSDRLTPRQQNSVLTPLETALREALEGDGITDRFNQKYEEAMDLLDRLTEASDGLPADWGKLMAEWETAVDEVSRQISALRNFLMTAPEVKDDDELLEIARTALVDFSKNNRIRLIAALMDAQNAKGKDRGKALAEVKARALAFSDALKSDETIEAVDENPWSERVPCSVRSTYGQVLSRLAAIELPAEGG